MIKCDVLIVGAGILGLSTAYHIKKSTPSLKVLVLEKNVAAGLGSTVNSAAAFRCFFSSKTNLSLVDSSVEFYRNLESTGVNLKMRWCGYLWTFTQKEYHRVDPILKEFSAQTLPIKQYLPEELSRILGMCVVFKGGAEIPPLEDIHRALFIPKAELIGVMSLVHYYESEFLKMAEKYDTELKSRNLLLNQGFLWVCRENLTSGRNPS